MNIKIVASIYHKLPFKTLRSPFTSSYLYLAFLLLSLAAPINALAVNLFDATVADQRKAQPLPDDIRLSLATPMAQVSQLSQQTKESDEFLIHLPDGQSYTIIAEHKQIIDQQYLMVTGYIEELSTDDRTYLASFVLSNSGLAADFELADGQYATVVDNATTWLIDPHTAQSIYAETSFDNDTIDPGSDGSFIQKSPSVQTPANKLKNSTTRTTVLNVALVLSPGFGTGESAVTEALEHINVANMNYDESGVEIRLNPSLVIRTTSDFGPFSSLNDALDAFAASGIAAADLSDPNKLVSPSGATELNIHKFVLMTTGQPDQCGLALSAQRTMGQFSAVTRNTCPGRTTLAHEIGHLLTLIHNDGVIKHSIGAKGVPITWRSIMKSGLPPSGENVRQFYTGGHNSIISEVCLPPTLICNVEPFGDHNSIGILDTVRNSAAALSTPISINPVGPPVDLNNFGLSGSWDIAEGQNQGIIFENNTQQGNGLIIGAWFTYIHDGDSGQNNPADQRWYSLSGSGPFTGQQAQLGIFQTTEGVFDDPTDASTVQVGVATLSFSSCTEGNMQFTFNNHVNGGASGSLSLNRLTPPIGCNAGSPSNTGAGPINDFGLTGAWFEQATAGQGFYIEVNPEINLLFAGWFTFNNASSDTSEQRWYTIQGNYNPNGTSVTASIIESTGGRFNKLDAVESQQVGEATIDFISCTSATLAYSFDSNGPMGTIPLSRVGPNVTCGN